MPRRWECSVSTSGAAWASCWSMCRRGQSNIMFLRTEQGDQVYRLADIEEITVEFAQLEPAPAPPAAIVRAMIRGQKIKLNPKNDFAVLCSNCHKMIHKTAFVSDVQGFSAQHLQKLPSP